MRHKGVICGILAAVCYGTNPFGALPLYEEGVNTSSVLFYRFSMAVVMLGVMLLVERITFSTVTAILSLVLMTIAVHEVGATPTAIMGALEPLTAVAIGVLVFGEALTVQLVIGIVLILSAVLLIVLGKNFHLRTITHTISTIVRKTWRWK